MPLLALLLADCECWLNGRTELLFNERHFQAELMVYLIATRHYDRIHAEYSIPLEELKKRRINVPQYWNGSKKKLKLPLPVEFPWNENIRIDIVVEKDGRYAAIELKYATRSILNEKDAVKIFGEKLDDDSTLIKTHGAADLGMYRYWKDVRRIEVLKQCFEACDGGLAIIITNDHYYWDELQKKEVGYAAFSLAQEMSPRHGLLEWGDTIGTKSSDSAENIPAKYPRFILDGHYSTEWHDTAMPFRTVKQSKPTDGSKEKCGQKFRYNIIVIN